MTVSSSTHLFILNKADESNKCPLKVSLLGIPQEVLNVIKEDAVVQILVSDYVSQEVNFNVKVVFPCRSTHFAYVKDNIRPRESFIFVVGQLETIKNEFYVYARDINCIDAQFISKKNILDHSISYSSSSKNSVRSKLLVTHDNFAECLKGFSENGGLLPTVLSDNNNKFKSNSLSNDTYSSKCVRVEDFDDSIEEFCDDFAENSKGRINNNVSAKYNDRFSGSESNFEAFTGGNYKNDVNNFDDRDQEEDEGVLRVM